MAQPVWTDETEALVMVALHQADCEHSLMDCINDQRHLKALRAVLGALASARLLISEEVRDGFYGQR